MRNGAKQAIQDAFRTLLLAKSLDKITVRDIVEECGVTRNTFYYHYEDIYDLFDDYLDTQMREAYRTIPDGDSWDAMLLKLLDCVCETPQMGRHIFFSRKSEAMRLYLHKVLSATLDRYVGQRMQGLALGADDRRLIYDACCHALYGCIVQWLTGPDAPLLRARLQRLLQSFAGAIRAALEYCAKNPQEQEELL